MTSRLISAQLIDAADDKADLLKRDRSPCRSGFFPPLPNTYCDIAQKSSRNQEIIDDIASPQERSQAASSNKQQAYRLDQTCGSNAVCVDDPAAQPRTKGEKGLHINHRKSGPLLGHGETSHQVWCFFVSAADQDGLFAKSAPSLARPPDLND